MFCSMFRQLCHIQMERIQYNFIHEIHDTILNFFHVKYSALNRGDFPEFSLSAKSCRNTRVKTDLPVRARWIFHVLKGKKSKKKKNRTPTRAYK